MIALEAQESLRIRPSRTTRIECVTGVLWVTREGDWRDFIVAPGEFIEVGRGLTIAMALEPAIVHVAQQSLWSWLRGIFEPLRSEIRWRSSSAATAYEDRVGQHALARES